MKLLQRENSSLNLESDLHYHGSRGELEMNGLLSLGFAGAWRGVAWQAGRRLTFDHGTDSWAVPLLMHHGVISEQTVHVYL